PTDFPLYLASGITAVRTVGTPFQLAMERVAERGQFPSPRLITISPPIDGVGPTGRTDMPRGAAMTAGEQAEPLVQRFVRGGYHQIKAFSLLRPEHLRALGRAAVDAGVRLVANCPNAMTMEEAVDAGVTCFEQLHNVARGHLRSDAPEPPFWDRFDPVPGTRLDFGAIRRLARFMAERETWNVPTLIFHQRGGQSPEVGMANPALKYVSRSSITDWESTLIRWARRAKLSVEEWRAAARERARCFADVVAIFHDEGVPLLAGSDSLNPWNVPGTSLHEELQNFVNAGMTPFAALRCATADAARFVGEADRWGTVTVGKRADLVIVGRNPLRDVGALREIQAVCANGYYLTRADLDRLLEQRAACAAAPPVLPRVHLARVSGESRIVAEGTWNERIAGADAGRVVYRHSRLPDGGWLVEESHVVGVPRRHVERRNTRLVLDPNFTMRSCEYTVDSFAGSEVGRIEWSAPGEYIIQVTEVDGWKSEGRVPGERMLPSERVTATLWPLVFAQRSSARELLTVPALDVADGGAVRDLGLALTNEPHEPEIRGVLNVDRPTHGTEQVYRLTSDGRLLGMKETMPLLWLRELEPAEKEDASS
ncbi:MAG: hypothetical protein DMD81_23545, partial [Candidatus Rokuibacteriota bacterium]